MRPADRQRRPRVRDPLGRRIQRPENIRPQTFDVNVKLILGARVRRVHGQTDGTARNRRVRPPPRVGRAPAMPPTDNSAFPRSRVPRSRCRRSSWWVSTRNARLPCDPPAPHRRPRPDRTVRGHVARASGRDIAPERSAARRSGSRRAPASYRARSRRPRGEGARYVARNLGFLATPRARPRDCSDGLLKRLGFRCGPQRLRHRDAHDQRGAAGGKLLTSNVPSSARTRWRMEARPCEPLGEKLPCGIPRPSSVMRKTTVSSSMSSDTCTSFAPECLAMLVKASWAMRNSAMAASAVNFGSSSGKYSVHLRSARARSP